MHKKALLIVDLQNDFCPGGSLAVDAGDEVIPLANQLQNDFDIIVASKDWHPEEHVSFKPWPVHCVQDTFGAELHPDLDMQKITKIIHKGIDSHIDSYSAFYDNEHLRSTGLTDYLREQNVTDVYIMGLATDYCVKYSALDALRDGFNVFVVANACRGVELTPGDTTRAFDEMRTAGVVLV